MATWKKIKIGDFLFEREGRYKPDSLEIAGFQRIDKIDFSGNFHIANKPSKTDMILIKPGDLAISGINVAKGALGIYHGQEDVTATIHYSSYTFDENKVSVEYFKRFLKSPAFIQLLKEQVKGGIKTEIKPKHLLPLEILLPDKKEQLAILNRFQRIENEDADLKSELIHQQTLLKKLRQQILQEAIEGRLTADWRAQNPDVEPASELLKRIAAEKTQLVKDKKIKAQKPLPPIADKEKPFELPQGWEWCRAGALLNSFSTGPFGSILHKSDYVSNGIPLVNPANIVNGRILPSAKMMIDEKTRQRLSRYILQAGDMVVARRGDLSKCAVVSSRESGWLCGTGSFFLQLSGFIHSDYFLKVYRSSFFQRAIVDNSIGQTMANLNQKILNHAVIPIPSLKEQQAIVTKVEKLLTLCDQLETQITQNQAHAEQLMQAVLKEAFSQNKAETQKISTVVPFKPKGSDYYKRTLLAAEIVYQLHNEPTLGHLKLQKLIYLCQKSENMQLPVNFLQQAAGPYDPQMARSLDKQLYDKSWFQYCRDEVPKYKPLQKAGEHKLDFQKYFFANQVSIQTIIDLFRKAKSDQMEIVATLYACWEKIIESKEPFSNELLIQMFYAWSEEKSKFPEEQLTKAVAWMQEKNIVPDVNRKRN